MAPTSNCSVASEIIAAVIVGLLMIQCIVHGITTFFLFMAVQYNVGYFWWLATIWAGIWMVATGIYASTHNALGEKREEVEGHKNEEKSTIQRTWDLAVLFHFVATPIFTFVASFCTVVILHPTYTMASLGLPIWLPLLLGASAYLVTPRLYRAFGGSRATAAAVAQPSTNAGV